jgi:hypothetical protein
MNSQKKSIKEVKQLEDKAGAKHNDRMEVLAVAIILTVKDCRLLLGGCLATIASNI